jgi:hypothetical protein
MVMNNFIDWMMSKGEHETNLLIVLFRYFVGSALCVGFVILMFALLFYFVERLSPQPLAPEPIEPKEMTKEEFESYMRKLNVLTKKKNNME